MNIRVEVAPRGGHDARGHHLAEQARVLGLAVDAVEVRDLFYLGFDAEPAPEQVAAMVEALLVDPVTNEGHWPEERPAEGHVVEVSFLPGVTDTVGASLVQAAHDLGFSQLRRAATGHRYVVRGDLDGRALGRLARGLLANEVVQQWTLDGALPPPFVGEQTRRGALEHIPVRGLDDEGLLELSRVRRLSLDLAEMKAIQSHFEAQGREPTDVELEMLAQTWSEHCVHKTFRARIECDDDGERYVVDSMFDTYIRSVTEQLSPPWLRSVFVDNAGIVAFDDDLDLAFKVETHNHPSALEPFGGANTGVGGVVRDVIGVSARPIATTDVLCFGPQDLDPATLPDGVLHPRRIAHGVIDGIGDYGNKMGIPTVNGAVVHHPGYTANPLVYCGCLGVLPSGSHPRDPQVGDLVVCLGGRTGRDGLRGATFSSMEMGVETAEVAGTSVQIGNPIQEKIVLDAVMDARDERLYTAITDCGAGGLSSAVGEMGAELGVEVDLSDVPLKYPGLAPWEIWLSEAQERMVLAVPETSWGRLRDLCEARGVEATVLGRFTGEGRVVVRHGDEQIADLDCHFLHDGIPQRQLRAEWVRPPDGAPPVEVEDTGETLLELLASPAIRSREEIVRTYDHEVQGGTVVKPFVGPERDGPGDAAVLWPQEAMTKSLRTGAPARGVALSVGINPRYGERDPYRMAWAAVDEAVRNAVCVGADPAQVALLDNFCWGNPTLPDRLGALVRCARGCRDAALAFGAPYISGKDSLNNEYTDEAGTRRAIPGTILISAMAIVPDLSRTVTMDLKRAGNLVYVVGQTAEEWGGSTLFELRGLTGGDAPAPREDAPAWYRAVHECIRSGWVRAAHDASEGGLAVAAAEMSLAGHLGLELDVLQLPTEGEPSRAARCFAESTARLLLEVEPAQQAAVEAALSQVPHARAGQVTDTDELLLRAGTDTLARLPLAAMRRAFTSMTL